MWLPWEYGLLLALLCFAGSRAARGTHRATSAFLHEAGIVSVLYALWQVAGRLSLLSIEPAVSRGAALWDLERALRLPNEATMQNWMVPHSLWTQAANLYYAGVHVPAMGVFLVWQFLRYRDQYPVWRNTLAFMTGACLVIQLYPVAPPRLTDETMMIDTGLAYGQSVYGVLGRGIAGQLQAMPSIHVGWAALIGWAVWKQSPSTWRWIAPAHFSITFVVVALTGNHYWLDGIVAMVLLWISWHLARWIHLRLNRGNLAAAAAAAAIATACATTPVSEQTVSEQNVSDTTQTTTTLAPSTTTPVSEQTVSEQTVSDTGEVVGAAGTRTGAEIAAASGFSRWQGSRVGVIAHSASVTIDGTHVADLVDHSPAVELVALFGPEHGIRGDFDAGELVDDGRDVETGVPIFSLYGQTRSPTPSMLTGIDVLFYDLQDVGTRYYTYISTMGLAMQAAAEQDITFVVLDRPNPLGDRVEGDLLDPAHRSFVGLYEIPEVYGLTSGELAQAIKAERLIDGIERLDLQVVELEGWDRSGWPEDRPWVAPSPAITSIDSALLYPAVVPFEATTLNYGRGTDIAFQVIGAPWLDGTAIADTMNELELEGINFAPFSYVPEAAANGTVAYGGERLDGLRLEVTDADTIKPTDVAVRLLEVVVATGVDAGLPVSAIIDRPQWLAMLSGNDRLFQWVTNSDGRIDPLRQRPIDTADIGSVLETYQQR